MNLFNYFPTLQNPESYFEKVAEQKDRVKTIASLLILLALFSIFYGVSMGAYHSFLQAFVAALKLFSLYLLALVICFPAFYIIQYVLGSTLKLTQMLTIILSGFVLMTAIMVSFTPIIIFFLLIGSNYYFLQLLHISIFILSGFFGMKTIHDALQYFCDKQKVYPRTGIIVFRFWIVILVFVGIQLAWNLRPFLGDANKPFKLFRNYEGNFYTALIYSARQLSNSEPPQKMKKIKPDTSDDTLNINNYWK